MNVRFLLALVLLHSVTQAALPRVQINPATRGFSTNSAPFVPLGVNYFRPGTGWAPKLWKQFDAEATRKDLAKLRQMGGNCVRVFLTFGSFYETPGKLSEEGLSKLDQLLNLAEEAGIYVHPTGPDHWEGVPNLARTDRYADEQHLAALEEFWKLLAARYRGRTALFAYDLLNEPAIGWEGPHMQRRWNAWLIQKYETVEKLASAWKKTAAEIAWGQLAIPPAKDAPGDPVLLEYQLFREYLADEWTRRQAAAIKSADPDALVTVGLIQWSVPVLLPGSVKHYSGFRPERQAQFLDFLEVHFYPLEHGFYEYGGPQQEKRNLAYLESVVRETARPGKPVLLAEFGWHGGGKLTINEGKHPEASEEAQARWCRLAVETTTPLACGWLNWGFYDHPEARDVTQLTGLLTVDGKNKAWGDEFEKLSRAFAKKPAPTGALGPRPDLDWTACLTSQEANATFRKKYLQAFEAAKAEAGKN